MPLPDHLTTTNTGHYAGTWHDLPDGTPRYYTHAHIEHMKALDGKSSTDNTDVITAVREKHNRARRVAAKRTEKGTLASAAKRRAAKEAA